ncbi:hypothetical protein BJ508DRAFT_329294 [Ascobolus immersus RN42]|uniref:F-box domain-containing protein n=1 Tax=Ascobolus immersus RN42 TaxID=1160509 RepID=A0A3N4HWW2_ASCIM|nr:hypothetical protein BJ508DRAFT_329294 [Ascobolus immersus RN42]
MPSMFYTLPVELRLEIYSHCTAFTLIMLSHFCRRLYLEINKYPSVYTHCYGYTKPKPFRYTYAFLHNPTPKHPLLRKPHVPLSSDFLSRLSSPTERDLFLSLFPARKTTRPPDRYPYPSWMVRTICHKCLRIISVPRSLHHVAMWNVGCFQVYIEERGRLKKQKMYPFFYCGRGKCVEAAVAGDGALRGVPSGVEGWAEWWGKWGRYLAGGAVLARPVRVVGRVLRGGGRMVWRWELK